MEADIGEGGDEIEQDAEADRIGRDELRVAKCRSICSAEAASPSERTKFFSRGSVAAMTTRAGERDRGEDDEAVAPAGEVGDDAGDQAPDEAAEARARDIDAGDAGDLVGRPFVADIGDRSR